MSTTKNNPILQPYLFFDGRCEEAIEFYRRAIAAELVQVSRYKDCPQSGMAPPGSDNKVMHARFRIGDTTVLATDGRCLGKTDFQGFSLSLTVTTEAEAQRLFAALSEGGKVQMPLAKTFFSAGFGMLSDKFGVPWMVCV